MRASKSVTQPFSNVTLDNLLNECLAVTYGAIHYGELNGIDNRKGMKGFYSTLKAIQFLSCYKVGAITRACTVIKSRKKSGTRGIGARHPKPLRPMVCIISGFFITAKGRLFIPLRRDRYFDVQLDRHVTQTLEGMKVRSLTITQDKLSFCYSKEVEPATVKTVYGVDRNEKNVTFGDKEGVVQVDVNEVVRIRQATRRILSSFRRNDSRIGRKLASKYWRRANHRTDRILHGATNFVVGAAVRNGAALALEDLTDIRRMYRRGGGQGSDYRFRLNAWPHWKAKRMLEYKARWKGVTTIQLTKSETYGSSSKCSACGERLRGPGKGDAEHVRMLWCQTCGRWTDRDVNAALNLSARGLARFASSLPRPDSRSQQVSLAEEKGLAGEAMRGNPMRTVILRVDASKLARGPTVDAPSRDPLS